MIFAAIAVGLLIGLSLGALGGGGSIMTVPALVFLLRQSPHAATTASLLVVGMAAVAGALTHARAGNVRLKAGAVFGALGIAGSYLGSRAGAAVPSRVLLAGFGALMLGVVVLMLVRRRREVRRAAAGPGDMSLAEGGIAAGGTPGASAASVATTGAAAASLAATGDRPGGAALTATLVRPAGTTGRGPFSPADDRDAASSVKARDRRSLRRLLVIAAAATGVGLITGFFGVGGGFVVVPALILVLGLDMATAAGTSLVVIAIDSAAALASRAGHGSLILDWALIGTFTGAAVVGALAGVRVAGRASPERLSTAFAALIVVIALYTLARSVPALI